MSDTSLPEGLGEWAAALEERYDLSAEQIPTDAILKLAAVAAHSVTRPAAPLTTFVAGLLAGIQGGAGDDIDARIAELAEAARAWEGESTTASEAPARPEDGGR